MEAENLLQSVYDVAFLRSTFWEVRVIQEPSGNAGRVFEEGCDHILKVGRLRIC